MDEDWVVLRSFLPPGWEELGRSSGALKGLRKDKSAESVLRVLLLHLGCGHSLRETALRARKAGLAQLSDVALLKRLRKSSNWLHGLCVALFRERGLAVEPGLRVRAFDATTVREPGRTGSLWRLHYSLCLSSLSCDFFEVTPARGVGGGEYLARFPVSEGDHILADRGYSTAAGLRHVSAAGGRITVRVNTGGLFLRTLDGAPFDLLAAVSRLKRAGTVGSWPAATAGEGKVCGRICAVRKSAAAAARARKTARREAQRKGSEVKPETLAFADYVIVFTTFGEEAFSAREVLEWYRLRWQVELVFKRLKSLAQLGHLPKHDDESARAWLYGKLLVALLADKLVRHARALSPWGYDLAPPQDP
ncbi:MAG: IS4 family transposase [Rhodospirillaceae bacterium]|nr:IS4 family transposase [Rhodospirillaceae bacterium]